MTRVLVGLFENRGEAERTVEHLTQTLGVNPKEVEIHGAGEAGSPQPGGDTRPGVLRWLSSLFMPRDDYEVFREGLRRQGVVVVARVRESLADRAMDVFEEHGAADLDARQVDWRGAEWSRHTGGTGHDEDIGFATYGDDAVLGHIPKHHHDNTRAGLLGRLEMAVMREDSDRTRRSRVRSFGEAPKTG